MAEDKIYRYDEGTHFQLELQENGAALDIGAATEKKIKFLKPSGALITKDAAFVTDGTDGLIEYITLATDLDEADGEKWEIQGWVRLPDGAWHSTTDSFKVYTPLGG